jgi:hypothetical protein
VQLSRNEHSAFDNLWVHVELFHLVCVWQHLLAIAIERIFAGAFHLSE